jgi:hypothetical protein
MTLGTVDSAAQPVITRDESVLPVNSAGQIDTELADLLLMTHLSQSLLPLVSRHLVAFPLFAAWHTLLLN